MAEAKIGNSVFRGLRLAALLFVAAIYSYSPAVWAAQVGQETFSTPENAVDAFVAANRSGDPERLLKILGPRAQPLVFSGDPVADMRGRNRFLDAYDTAYRLDGGDGDRRVLVVGERGWPFPIPIVREGAVWVFDTEEGEQEILDRRIGRNELKVMRVCHAYVDAQLEFAEGKRAEEGLIEYAQKIHSTEGERDGLYWETDEGEEDSPLGALMAVAEAKGYGTQALRPETPYYGYYYRILTRQGSKAPGGAMNYIEDGRMTKGFALVAYPAKYGASGVMTFVVNHDGVVFEKNLGPRTQKIAESMTEYNPDMTWDIP